jgi:hypothetical protein
VVGPFFNDLFGDVFGIIYGFTQRELRDYVEEARSKLLNVPDVSKIELIGAQDEVILASSRPATSGSRCGSEGSGLATALVEGVDHACVVDGTMGATRILNKNEYNKKYAAAAFDDRGILVKNRISLAPFRRSARVPPRRA